ncbi:MAG: hypothetical protein FJX45_05260 [Alphaproteobacteria bacterium]|nr:hypothetical protein [Alphaproteobacteria bacterium]
MAGDDKPNKFVELTPALAIASAIAGSPVAFLKASGLADDIGVVYGVSVKDLIWVVAFCAGPLLACVFLWYYETLGGGAEAAGSGLRERFHRERARLAGYRSADDGYAQRLKAFLAWIDRFFDGDNPPSQRARILSEPAHVWTAAAYDRCLLLALIYPIVVIFFSWTIAGHVGPAESALGIKEADGWLRAGFTIAFVLFGVSFFKFMHAEGLPILVWVVALTLVFAAVLAFAIAGAGVRAAAGATIATFAIVIPYHFVGAGAGAGVGAFALAVALAFTSFLAFAGALALATVSAVAAVALSIKANQGNWQGQWLSVYSALVFMLCFFAARSLSTPVMAEYMYWDKVKPLLLFLSLFTIVNAPFDWLSLGLTRLLLRYGVEKGGYWPYALAFVDAVVASVLITILALAMVWSNDLFNFLAEQGGGEQARVLPPSRFYLGMLERDPAAPEFWWLYATLFSTMIPSVINLFIAGFSFLRTLPWTRNFLLSNLREGETMPIVVRLISSSILTVQVALAWPLAIAAQVFLTYVVLWQIMPRLGLGILHLVETLGFG